MKLKFYFLFFLLILSSCGTPHKYEPCRYPEPLPAVCVPERIRVALVLGSGGVRGMAHIGVLEVLEDAGIPIDLIVGCSAGSLVGALYAENPHVEDIKCAVWQLKSENVLDIDIFNCRYGLSKGSTLNRVLDNYLCAETFDDLKIPLIVVASDLYSGELIPISSGDLATAVRASCSIPFVFTPCEHMGRILVDGGVINPVPVRVAHDLGAEVVIAVDLCELLPKTFPTNLFQIMTRSAEIAFMWQNEVCTRTADVVIRPKTCGVGTFDDTKKKLLYEAGKRAAIECLSEIKKMVAELSKIDPKQCDGKRFVQLGPYTPKIYMGDYPDNESEEGEFLDTYMLTHKCEKCCIQ